MAGAGAAEDAGAGGMKKYGVDNPAFEPPGPEEAQPPAPGVPPGSAGAPGPSPGPEEPEARCGWGKCTPRALQLCNNAEGYLVFYSLLSIFQGEAGKAAEGKGGQRSAGGEGPGLPLSSPRGASAGAAGALRVGALPPLRPLCQWGGARPEPAILRRPCWMPR